MKLNEPPPAGSDQITEDARSVCQQPVRRREN
jgi:hypothetical protein